MKTIQCTHPHHQNSFVVTCDVIACFFKKLDKTHYFVKPSVLEAEMLK